MSKRLLFFRHAKSDWEAKYDNDHERPLARRGSRIAMVMGRVLTASQQLPEMVFCSSAIRARRTLELAQRAGGWERPVEIRKEIYAASPEGLLELAAQLPDKQKSIMLIGHEPGFSETIGRLIGGRVSMPTASVARVDLSIKSWRDIAPGKGKLIWLLQPKFFCKGNWTEGILDQEEEYGD